jgi:hypothetical protein
VEVRSEGDYGPIAEQAMAQKRADYFACGTLVVWDVDLLSEEVVRVYRATDLDQPTIYRRGEIAEAEPAVSGWRMPVDELFVESPDMNEMASLATLRTQYLPTCTPWCTMEVRQCSRPDECLHMTYDRCRDVAGGQRP